MAIGAETVVEQHSEGGLVSVRGKWETRELRSVDPISALCDSGRF